MPFASITEFEADTEAALSDRRAASARLARAAGGDYYRRTGVALRASGRSRPATLILAHPIPAGAGADLCAPWLYLAHPAPDRWSPFSRALFPRPARKYGAKTPLTFSAALLALLILPPEFAIVPLLAAGSAIVGAQADPARRIASARPTAPARRAQTVAGVVLSRVYFQSPANLPTAPACRDAPRRLGHGRADGRAGVVGLLPVRRYPRPRRRRSARRRAPARRAEVASAGSGRKGGLGRSTRRPASPAGASPGPTRPPSPCWAARA